MQVNRHHSTKGVTDDLANPLNPLSNVANNFAPALITKLVIMASIEPIIFPLCI
jgi:hypothetical protein